MVAWAMGAVFMAGLTIGGVVAWGLCGVQRPLDGRPPTRRPLNRWTLARTRRARTNLIQEITQDEQLIDFALWEEALDDAE